ncbi:MAG: DUF11 domain-containing protein [Planctomycetota bacterium]|nr:MAG: DUF11 domain-containing protein [Planctomycetota bacterium]
MANAFREGWLPKRRLYFARGSAPRACAAARAAARVSRFPHYPPQRASVRLAAGPPTARCCASRLSRARDAPIPMPNSVDMALEIPRGAARRRRPVPSGIQTMRFSPFRSTSTNSACALAVAALLLPALTGCQTAPKEETPAPVVANPQPKQEAPKQTNTSNMSGAVSMAFPTGDAATSAVLLEKLVPQSVVLGQNFTYEIRVKNLTGMTLENVVVSEQMSPNFKVASQAPQPNMVGMVANYAFKNIPPRGSETIKITGAPNAKDAISCCASVTYNQMLCASTLVIQPALKVAAVAPSEVLICDEFPVEFTVTNPGDGNTNDVKVMATLPQGLVSKSGNSQVALEAGMLKPGESKKVTVFAKASKTGSYANAGKATGANNLSADSNTVTTTVRQPILKVGCNAPAERYIGRKATYEFTVNNSSDVQSQSTVIETTIPAGLQVSEISDNGKSSGGVVRWDLGTLAAGASKKLSLAYNSNTAGKFNTTTSVRALCAEAVTCPAQTEWKGIPAVLLEVVDSPDPVEVGNTTTYTIDVTNQGSAPATNVKVAATLPPSEAYVSSAGSTTGTADGASITFAPVGVLAVGGRVQFKIVVKGVTPADARIKVTMTCDQLKGEPVQETESTTIYQ